MNDEDPILAEIRQFREEYAARFNYDLAAIGNELRTAERHNKHQTVSLAPRPYLLPSQQFPLQVEPSRLD